MSATDPQIAMYNEMARRVRAGEEENAVRAQLGLDPAPVREGQPAPAPARVLYDDPVMQEASDRLAARKAEEARVASHAKLAYEVLLERAGDGEPLEDILSPVDAVRLAFGPSEDALRNDRAANIAAMQKTVEPWKYELLPDPRAVRDGRDLLSDDDDGGAE